MYNIQFVIDRIQKAISEKGFSQIQVLKKVGINKNAITSMGEKKGMGSFQLAKIADELDCSTDYLLGRTDVPDMNRRSGLSEEEEKLLFMFRELTRDDRIKAFDRVKVLYDDEMKARKQYEEEIRAKKQEA